MKGSLQIVNPVDGVQTHTWANANERAQAQLAFEVGMRAGGYLASVRTAEGKSVQIRNFSEVEEYEKDALKKGVAVEVRMTPAVAGG